MDSLIGDDYPFWLVIFPEGTTIHKEYVVKSQAFAETYVLLCAVATRLRTSLTNVMATG